MEEKDPDTNGVGRAAGVHLDRSRSDLGVTGAPAAIGRPGRGRGGGMGLHALPATGLGGLRGLGAQVRPGLLGRVALFQLRRPAS